MKRRVFLKSAAGAAALSTPAIKRATAQTAPTRNETLVLVQEYGPNSMDMQGIGTDQLGRDILSRVIVATRVVVGIALASVALVFSAGGLVGLAAGFYGGWVDAVIGRIADTIMALPLFVLAMGIVAALGNTIPNIVLVTAIWMWLFSRKPPPS